jgi:hypothetical protein
MSKILDSQDYGDQIISSRNSGQEYTQSKFVSGQETDE